MATNRTPAPAIADRVRQVVRAYKGADALSDFIRVKSGGRTPHFFSRTAILSRMSGRVQPEVRWCRRLCDLTGIRFEWLWDGQGGMRSGGLLEILEGPLSRASTNGTVVENDDEAIPAWALSAARDCYARLVAVAEDPIVIQELAEIIADAHGHHRGP